MKTLTDGCNLQAEGEEDEEEEGGVEDSARFCRMLLHRRSGSHVNINMTRLRRRRLTFTWPFR